MGLEGGNLYGYGEANPLSNSDPLGLQGVGHHWVPQSIWRNEGLSTDAARVFVKAVTGPFPDGSRHGWSTAHSEYNKGVRDLWNKWINVNSIDPKNMTAQKDNQFVDEVYACKDPGVREYSIKVRQVLFRSYFHRIPIRGIE